jgi:hypothetical protein
VKSILRRRPSPALVISCIALFLALGGVSYGVATGSIDGREIKNNSVRSKDVRNNTLQTFDIRNNQVRGFDIRNSTVQGRDVALNTLTGADISEASLAKVPLAANADSAATATTVAGMSVRKFFAKPPSGAGVAEIFRGDGFALEAGCPGGVPALRINGVAGSPAANVVVSGTASTGPAPIFEADDSLVAGAPVDLLGAGPDGGGTATVSTTGGGVSTIVYAAQSAPAFAGENACAIRGTVTSG